MLLFTSKRCYVLFCLVIHLAVCTQNCPRPQKMPLNTASSSNELLCARVYMEYHCNGDHLDVGNGEHNLDLYRHTAVQCKRLHGLVTGEITSETCGYTSHPWNDRISSVVVRPGCRFQAFEDGFRNWWTLQISNHNNGASKMYFSGVVKNMGWWSDRISAYKCDCHLKNEVLSCQPQDKYETVFSCSNTLGNGGDMTCSQSITIGTTYGNSVSEGKSTSETWQGSVDLTIKKVFSLGLGYSKTTGYDWTTTSSDSYRRSKSVSASCTVKAGETVELRQLVGFCSDIQVQTPTYKCVSIRNFTKILPSLRNNGSSKINATIISNIFYIVLGVLICQQF